MHRSPRILAVLLTVALAFGIAAAAPPQPARATDDACLTTPPTVSATSVSPTKVILGPVAGSKSTFKAKVVLACPATTSAYVTMLLAGPGDVGNLGEAGDLGNDVRTDSYVWDPMDESADRGEFAGTWSVVIRVSVWEDFLGTWYDYRYEPSNMRFTVKWTSTISATASSKSVKKGSTVSLRGVLRRADFQTHTYTAYAGKRAQLQVQTKNGFRKLKDVSVDGSGRLAGSTKVKKNACYRLAFTSDSTTAPSVSRRICVKVKK